ncbi:hypothetical protein VTO73DRAFT_4036 [Trametes versicolor]
MPPKAQPFDVLSVFHEYRQYWFELAEDRYTGRCVPQTAQNEVEPSQVLGSDLNVSPKASRVPDDGTPVSTDKHQSCPGPLQLSASLSDQRRGRRKDKEFLEDLDKEFYRKSMDGKVCVLNGREAQHLEKLPSLTGQVPRFCLVVLVWHQLVDRVLVNGGQPIKWARQLFVEEICG